MSKKFAFAQSDNWAKFSYEKERFLDALASFFSFVKPCIAMKIDKDGKINASFNRTIASSTTQKYEHQTFETLKSALTQNQEAMLPLYILLNTDFISFISTIARKENSEEIKKIASNIRKIRAEFTTKFKILQLKEFAKNLKKLEYEQKTILDQINDKDSEEYTKAKEAYNITKIEADKIIGSIIKSSPLIKKIQKEAKSIKPSDLELKKAKQSELKQATEAEKAKYNYNNNNSNKEYSNLELFAECFKRVKEQYMELIESAKNNNLDNEKIKELIRPLQDILKVSVKFPASNKEGTS